MTEDSQQSYGAWIKGRRKDRGLSLKEISEEIRISEQYLKALETGNIILLPEPYMRVFLKTYSSYLGLDPEEALRRFETFLKDRSKSLEVIGGVVHDRDRRPGHATEATTGVAGTGQKTPNLTFDGFSTHRWPTRILLPVIIACAAIVVTYVLIKTTGEGENRNIPEMTSRTPAPDPEVAEPVTPPPVIVAEEDSVSITTEERARTDSTEGQLLIADALEETWLEATADGQIVITRTIPQGNSLEVAFRDTLELKLGKSQGMRLTLNGEELTNPGPAGMILHIVLTVDGIVSSRLTYPPETIPSFLNRPPPL